VSKPAKAHSPTIAKRLAASSTHEKQTVNRKAKRERKAKKSAAAIPQADPHLHPPRTPGFVTWCELLMVELHAHDETFADIVITAPLPIDWLHVEFKPRAWQSEGCPFTVWTAKRVYFPVTDCLSEWVGSVSREPDGQVTLHQGVEIDSLGFN
jgi:hypothetical protein